MQKWLHLGSLPQAVAGTSDEMGAERTQPALSVPPPPAAECIFPCHSGMDTNPAGSPSQGALVEAGSSTMLLEYEDYNHVVRGWSRATHVPAPE